MSDKANIKQLRKQAELALDNSPVPVIGERIPNVYDWGTKVLTVMLSIDERLRALEARLADLEFHVVKTISSNTIVQATEEQTINSDSEVSE